MDEKAKGDECARSECFHDACLHYTTCIEANSTVDDALRGAAYSNRSMCHLRLGSIDNALIDAEMACFLRPDWSKVAAQTLLFLTCLEVTPSPFSAGDAESCDGTS